MGNTITVLADFFKEFIPALKVECIIVGVGLIVMSLCLLVEVYSSGLSGKLSYLILNPGVTVPSIVGGIALIVAALVMKPVPRELM